MMGPDPSKKKLEVIHIGLSLTRVRRLGWGEGVCILDPAT